MSDNSLTPAIWKVSRRKRSAGSRRCARMRPMRVRGSSERCQTHRANLTLRHVQHALAREHGFAGWKALKEALAALERATGARTLAKYETKAEALLDAYRTGTPEAMERHCSYTWHRRKWHGMRTYVQLDLGKRPTGPDDCVKILRPHVLPRYDGRGNGAHHRLAEPLVLLSTAIRQSRDRTPELLSGMDSLERITFDTCHDLPRCRHLRGSRGCQRLREFACFGKRRHV